MMVTILTVIFLILVLLSLTHFFDTSGNELNRYVIFFFAAFLILLAGLRAPTTDRDYLGYASLIQTEERAFMEPTFTLLSRMLRIAFSNPVVPFFLIYAFIGVSVKVAAIKKYADFWSLSLLVYFSYSYLLHDMTQIRTGAAIGFALLSIYPLSERKFFKFFLLVALASSFHYSSFFILGLWFLDVRKINKMVYLGILILSYLAVAYVESFLTFIFSYLPEAIQFRAAAYDSDFGTTLNIFNAWQLIRCALCFIFIIYANKLTQYNSYAVLLIKIYVIGTALFVLFSSNPTFAGRISDLFFAFDILTIPMLVYLFRYRLIGRLFVIAIASSYLFLNLYYNKIIN